MYFFDNIKNNFDFFLRNSTTFSRKGYYEKAEDLSELMQEEFYLELADKYNLSLLLNSNIYGFKINLYLLNVFDKYFDKKTLDKISILDIGSKNWEYVKSEYIFFKSIADDFILNGVELDFNRLNSKFYSRYEIAKFYTKTLKNTNYIAGDFLEHNKKYDYIIWILPFITKYPLIKWGLPLRYFQPEKMLIRAYDLLNNGGQMLIINQGEKEYEIQLELNNKLGLKYKDLGEIEDKFNLFKNKRYCFKIIKTT